MVKLVNREREYHGDMLATWSSGSHMQQIYPPLICFAFTKDCASTMWTSLRRRYKIPILGFMMTRVDFIHWEGENTMTNL